MALMDDCRRYKSLRTDAERNGTFSRLQQYRPEPNEAFSAVEVAYNIDSTRHGEKEYPNTEYEATRDRPRASTNYGDNVQGNRSENSTPAGYQGHTGDSRHHSSTSFQAEDIPEGSTPRNHSRQDHSLSAQEWAAVSSSYQLSGSLAKLSVREVQESRQDPTASKRYDLLPYEDLGNGHYTSYHGKGKGVERQWPRDVATEDIPERIVRGTPGRYEALDRSYAKRTFDYKKFFRPGRVFSTLWTESYDDGTQSENDQFPSTVTYQVSKQRVFSKIRRFVVVHQAERIYTCLPVTSYNVKGSKKKGINLNNHGLIYSSKEPPPHVEGITKAPLRIIRAKRADKITNPTYINYGRVYTVETNVKVRDVGVLDSESLRLLRTFYREVQMGDDDSDAPSRDRNPRLGRDVELSGIGAAFGLNIKSARTKYSASVWRKNQHRPRHEESAWLYVRDPPISRDFTASSQIPPGQPTRIDSLHRDPGVSYSGMENSVPGGISTEDTSNTKRHTHGLPSSNADEASVTVSSDHWIAPTQDMTVESWAGADSTITSSAEQLPPNSELLNSMAKRTPETDPFKSADGDTTLPLSSKEPVLSRSCSIEYLESLFGYKESNSSRSSYTDEPQGVERLAELLFKDENLQDLYKVAAQKVTSERLRENFRRCLVQCSAHLKEEVAHAKSAAGLRCARVLQHYSRNAAAQVALCMGKQKTIDTGADSEHILDVGNKSHFQDESDDEDEDEDPVKKALLRTWPVSHQGSNPLEIVYHAPWIIPSFLKSSFAGDQALKSVLTISGSGLDAQAQSCGDYIAWNWPECGLLLEAFQDLLEQTSAGVEKRNNYMVLKLNVLDKVCDTSVVSVTVTAVHSTHEKVVSAVSWLCAAIRPSSHDHVTYSSVSIDAPKGASKSRIIEIQLKDLEEGFQNPGCWHPLFPHAVVAKGFPTRDRIHGKGKGLEISFGDMALLSQSLNIVEHGGGLVVEGLRSFLTPIALLPDGSVQWHFEYKRSGHCRKPRKLFEVSNKHIWSRDIEPLTSKISFKGGASLDRWMRLRSSLERRHSPPKPFAGTEGLGIFGVSANRTWLPVSVPSRIILQPNRDIADTLEDECDARTMPTKSSKGLNAKAVDILRDSLDLKMVKRGRSGNISARYFGDIVKEIWNALDMIENALVSNEAEWSTINKGAPKFLHSVEFRDLESMKPCMTILQAKLNKPWVHLVISEPTIPVLFCQGLGQAIVPRNPKMLCRPWISVPLGENYMVATCMTICSWLDRHNNGEGSRLSERVEWNVDPRASRDGLIYCHSTKKNSFVFHEQQLNFVKRASRNAKIYDLVMGHERGDLIFGSTRWRKGCSEKLDQSSSLQIRTTSLDFCSRIHLKQSDSAIQHPPDVPAGSSDTSAETEASFGIDSYSNPLSLSSSLVSQEIKERQYIEPSYSSPIVSPERTRCHPKYITQAKLEVLHPSGSRDQSMKSAPRTLKRMKKSIQLSSARTEGKNLSK
ncbi:hypothetical protein BKA61DRAFT_675769 [Leptodontidium sp. MPI-SDFR-AT-0119]|nr:hypothetical protein BKA61DRAFT_675769 [Leptodontidium sp. MPI-SDFR-AT-0119]